MSSISRLTQRPPFRADSPGRELCLRHSEDSARQHESLRRWASNLCPALQTPTFEGVKYSRENNRGRFFALRPGLNPRVLFTLGQNGSSPGGATESAVVAHAAAAFDFTTEFAGPPRDGVQHHSCPTNNTGARSKRRSRNLPLSADSPRRQPRGSPVEPLDTPARRSHNVAQRRRHDVSSSGHPGSNVPTG